MGLNARRKALASYGWSQIAARTQQLVASVADAPMAASATR